MAFRRRSHRTASSAHPVVQVGDTAGVPDVLAEGLVELGVPTVGFKPPPRSPRAGTARKALDAPLRLLDARSGLRKLSPSLVHVHYATAALWYLDRHPLVVHCHGTDVRGITGGRRRLLDLVFSRADLVVVATPDLLRDVPEGARYLPNPVDTDLVSPGAGDSGDPEGDVLVFSALSDIKGADQLLATVRELRERRPSLRITAIEMGDRVAEVAAAGATVVPRRPQAELPQLIGSHRVVLGQQHLRALGTAELQAMSCGRPVVGVADAGLYGGELPIAVGAGAGANADAVLRLLEDPAAAAQLGSAARSWVVRHHRSEAVVERLAGWYRQLWAEP